MIRLFEGASHAQAYALFRPCSPDIIAEKTMNYMKSRILLPQSGKYDCMIDVGCGSGQSSALFAPYFKKIIGIDPSEKQIEQAKIENKHSHIVYKVGQAENLERNEDVDLITSGQAVHWVDFESFFHECEVALKPNGCLLLHGYNRPHIHPRFPHDSSLVSNAERLFSEFYSKCLFHPRRKHVDNSYETIFEMINSNHKMRDDSIENKVDCTLSDLVSYIKTWTGYHDYLKKVKASVHSNDLNHDILNQFVVRLKQEWGINSDNLVSVPITAVYRIFMILSERPRVGNSA